MFQSMLNSPQGSTGAPSQWCRAWLNMHEVSCQEAKSPQNSRITQRWQHHVCRCQIWNRMAAIRKVSCSSSFWISTMNGTFMFFLASLFCLRVLLCSWLLHQSKRPTKTVFFLRCSSVLVKHYSCNHSVKVFNQSWLNCCDYESK